MKLIVCAVFDQAVGAFMRPFFVPSRGVAMRSFGDEVQREGSEMKSHPEDYSLHYLGTFDESTAQFDTLTMPERIALATDFSKT